MVEGVEAGAGENNRMYPESSSGPRTTKAGGVFKARLRSNEFISLHSNSPCLISVESLICPQ